MQPPARPATREGEQTLDPLTGDPVHRWRTELSPAALARLARPGQAVRDR